MALCRGVAVVLQPMKAILPLLMSFVWADVVLASDAKPPVGIPSDAVGFNGKWYKVYTENVTWKRAKEKCESLKGTLATVPDAATWEFVKTLTPASVWLGASDEATEGVWKWVDGSPVTFTAWVAKQPDNARKAEHFLSTHKGGWNDIKNDGSAGATQVVGFICQWSPR